MDDAAIQIMGGDWRMPTTDEFQELYNNTTNKWVTNYNGTGVNGRKFTGSNGNSIFFPASGYADGTGVDNRDLSGNYWSSSLHPSYSNDGLGLSFSSGYIYPQSNSNRHYGFCVRGVFK